MTPEEKRIEQAALEFTKKHRTEIARRLKAGFGERIHVDLLMKNNDGSHRFYRAGVDRIDNYIAEKYSVEDVKRIPGLH